ncbi:MAG: hypothetical protein AUJ72_00705 [Candidatus Omnitrophica bacterium CG1_02_46_14]|nr:MAG: hypothetical protein AUJ72_00705 [Candidatus Omnitrophica bacterium CG1_02_46_14]
MLGFEALTAEAEQRGMPRGKMRGVLREYLEILILKELYKLPEGRKLFFTGGTYLRLIHQTKRFSEDLDFNTENMGEDVFEGLLARVQSSLKKEGFEIKLAFGHWGNLLVGEYIFPSIEKSYGVTSAYVRKEGIVIKVEANRPRWRISQESFMVTGFGHLFPVACTTQGALFADKIDALVKKNRARHLFDIIFMLSKKVPIDTEILKTFGIKDPPLEVILKRVNTFSTTELKKQAESLRPFLFEESEADLLLHAPQVVAQLIERYRNG